MEERGKQVLLELLKAIRSEAGLKQAELAERLGVPQSFVSKYETGERRLDLLEVHRVCKASGISLGVFVKRLEAAIATGKRKNP